MTSAAKIRASRANGALSRGPRTPEGKRRAAGNSCRHGLYSKRVVLKSESQAEFDSLLAAVSASLQPQTPDELLAIHQVATAFWCLRRALDAERRLFNQHLPAAPTNPVFPEDDNAPA